MPPNCSLLEYKLRRYVYLGHHKNIYVPPSFRKSFWKNQKDLDDITGIQLIAKVVFKNNINEINSIVPILLKIKQENKIIEDQHLIFALAVCARFHVKSCIQMNANAYAAVELICKDGLQILKFAYMVKKASYLLFKQGYIKINTTGYGAGFKNAVSGWYLNNDPYQVTKQILMYRHYYGISHRDLMKICNLTSSDPCCQIFIVNTCFGFGKVRSDFSSMIIGDGHKIESEINSRLQLTFIYHYLEKMNDVYKNMTIKKMYSMTWEKDFLSIPKKCFQSFDGLSFFVTHCPLKVLLDHTFCLTKYHYFYNVQQYRGCWTFIARFNETDSLRNSGIHPIESYLEYIRYRYSGFYVSEIKDKNMKKLKKSSESTLFNIELWDPSPDATKVPEVAKKTKNLLQNQKTFNTHMLLKQFEKSKQLQFQPDYSMGFNIDDCNIISKNTSIDSIEVPKVVKKPIKQKIKSNPTKTGTRKVSKKIKPKPKKAAPLLKFLSEELVEKSLRFLPPLQCNILIGYDGRRCTYKQFCKYMHLKFVRVCDAIILVILSLIYPLRKHINKPYLCSLKDPKKPFSVIKMDSNTTMTFESLEKKLFEEFDSETNNSRQRNRKKIKPSNAINWAIRSGKSVDVFVFLGTNKMNIKNLYISKKLYEEFSGKKVKIIICCFTGGHVDKLNVCNQGMLFIAGFDKNVGKIIDAFINDEF